MLRHPEVRLFLAVGGTERSAKRRPEGRRVQLVFSLAFLYGTDQPGMKLLRSDCTQNIV